VSAPAAQQTGLSDLVDRAGAQLMILRRTLDEATALGNAARRESDALATRLCESQRSREQIEERIRQAGSALAVLDRAGETVRALEDVVGRLRGVREAMADEMERRLEVQRRAFDQQLEQIARVHEQRIERQERVWTDRLARLESLMNERFAEAQQEMPARIELLRDAAVVEIEQACQRLHEAGGNAERACDQAERRAREHAERLGAALDRQNAQTDARISLAIDSAQERLTELERLAQRSGQALKERVEELGRHATEALGIDPRSLGHQNGWRDNAAPGSLAEVVLHAEGVLHSMGRAVGQLGSAVAGAQTTIERITGSADEVAQRMERGLARSDSRALLLEKCMQDATRQAEELMQAAKGLRELIEQGRKAGGETVAVTTLDERAGRIGPEAGAKPGDQTSPKSAAA
jgi:hypothetical protein